MADYEQLLTPNTSLLANSGYLHLAYYGNAVCAIYLGFTIATALTSVFPINEFDNLEWIQIVRISSLSLLVVGYMVCAYWAKALSLNLNDGGFAPGPFDEESLLPRRHGSTSADGSTHSGIESRALEMEMQTSNPILADAMADAADESSDDGGDGSSSSAGVHPLPYLI